MARKRAKPRLRERLKRISAWGHIFVSIGDFLAGLAIGCMFAYSLVPYALPLLLAGIALHLPALYEILTKV